MTDKRDDIAHDGRGKEDRYGWTRLGARGELAWVDKDRIVVDPSYQRDANIGKVVEIASKFSWPAFGVATVVRRPGVHELFAVDAQHRVLGAQKRSDIRDVPCIIFDVADVAEEAKWFLQSNTLRKPVSAVEKHRAQAVTGDPIAAKIDSLAVRYGRRVGPTSGPNTVTCVAVLRRELERDPAIVDRVWPIVASLCEGQSIHEKIVAALCYVERSASESLTADRWAKRIRKAGVQTILNSIAETCIFHQKSGPKIWAEGALRAINKNLPDGARLKLVESTNGPEE